MGIAALLAVCIVGGYLIGAIPFGYLIARARGVNIFEHGSGNIGATNVGRVLGRRVGILVFVLDFAKGAVPAAVGTVVASRLGDLSPLSAATGVLTGLAAILGHMFSPYLGFRGGKGVATGAGVVAVLLPLPTVGALITWIGVLCGARNVALASIIAALGLCTFYFGLTPEPFADRHLATTAFCLVAAALVVVRHRDNIKRLLQGSEPRITESATMLRFSKIVHVLSLGLWFGSSVFFIVVALSLFNTFETIGESSKSRPKWFPLHAPFDVKTPEINGPKEQGSRVAGTAVAPLFLWHFLLQGACAFLAATSSLHWPRAFPGEPVHRRRTTVLLIALATVVIGWPLEQHVAALRVPRNQETEAYLEDPASETKKNSMSAARSEFAAWHLASMGLSFVTLIFVSIAMAQTAVLPVEVIKPAAESEVKHE